MRKWAGAVCMTMLVASCALAPESGPSPPLPPQGPILYSCDDGTQFTADYQGDRVAVAIVGGVTMVLPVMGADYYSNGRYTLRGAGAAASWARGRAAPVTCRGS